MEDPALARWMQQYAAGDDAAFDELYRLLSPRLYSFCLRLCGSRSEADDVCQQAFLRIHRARASYQAGRPVLCWTYAVARSAYLDRQKALRRHTRQLADRSEDSGITALPSRVASPEDLSRAAALAAVVRAALAELPEPQRTAYLLIKEDGFGVAEAAAVAGSTGVAVKVRAHRAAQVVRDALARAGWKEDVDDEDPGLEHASAR